jgi:hypothetical protein
MDNARTMMFAVAHPMRSISSFAALLLLACSSPAPADGGPLDAGDPGDHDGGDRDAGDRDDGGERSDASTPATPPALAVACDDPLDAVYAAAPSGDPMASRGAVRACAYTGWLSPEDLAAKLERATVDGVTPTMGAHRFIIAYQTTRSGGASAISSATVYLPDTLRASPSPALVAAHGTIGVADACAPSRVDGATEDLTIPFAARGWPVIAVDYAGLGTAGVQGYGDNDDTGRSTLDAARALRALLPEGTLTDSVVMVGHSQGGGSVLSAQALEASYGAGGDLSLVIPLAPGWTSGRDVNGFRYPGLPTTIGGGGPAAFASLFLYAWASNQLGPEHGGDLFGASVRTDVVAALERDCIRTLPTTIPAAAPSFGDLLDETFRAGLVSCADGGACTGTSQAMWDWQGANVLTPDATGASVLLYTGTEDTTVTPEDAACVVDRLEANGVAPTVCVDDSTHQTIVDHRIAWTVDYAEAFLAGTTLPACPTTGTLPACP